MTGVPTLEKIRAALPTHIMLTPGAHKWREGDEEYIDSEENFMEIDPHCAGCIVDHEGGRRPIPPHILDNQAWWIWYENFYDGTLIDYSVGQVEAQRKAGRLYDKWLLEQMEEI